MDELASQHESMLDDAGGATDSDGSGRGEIPGSAGHPAFTLTATEPSTIPVLIAVPHAGRAYPEQLVARMHNPGLAATRLEDRYIDLVGRMVARATGAGLLVAHAPRAMIDLNRAPEDIDWDMFDHGSREGGGSAAKGWRARSGLGVIPRRIPGLGELWNRRHQRSELEARLAGVHRPYHAALDRSLSALQARWGIAVLLDLHSMPPLGGSLGRPAPEFVIGDRFGASCGGRLVGEAFASLAEAGRLAAHNRPYAGGYVLDRHASPGSGRHALQIEVDRSCYLDRNLAEPGPGLSAIADVLSALVRRLAAEAVDLATSDSGSEWPEAAE